MRLAIRSIFEVVYLIRWVILTNVNRNIKHTLYIKRQRESPLRQMLHAVVVMRYVIRVPLRVGVRCCVQYGAAAKLG